MQCNKCLFAIDRKNERYTICEGRCAKRYHAACVGLSEATISALFSKNILWMCDECLLDFCNTRDASAEDVKPNDCCTHQSKCEAEIEELKTKVNDVIDVLTTMVSQRSQPGAHNHHHPPAASTPVLSSLKSDHLFDGTKETNARDSMSSSDKGTFEARNDFRDTFSLFITNVDRSTTDDDISKLVCECLNTDDHDEFRVKKLVSNQNLHELDYISFKITLDRKWKSLALQPSTWPKYLRYREFVNRRAIWKPSHS